MALRTEFAMHHSGYEPFLFAPIWEEQNGTPLSILSALARLGMDPWREAARLGYMRRDDAASALAAILARLPGNGTEVPNYPALAARLVEFLPKRSAAPLPEGRGKGHMDSGKIKYGFVLAVAAALVILQMKGWLF